jgi:hypothetical protein
MKRIGGSNAEIARGAPPQRMGEQVRTARAFLKKRLKNRSLTEVVEAGKLQT